MAGIVSAADLSAHRMLEPSLRLPVTDESRQLDAGFDAELSEDVPEVAVYGVGGDEESFGDFAVRQPVGHESGDRELGACHRRPRVRGRLGGDEATPNAERAQPAADAPRVP